MRNPYDDDLRRRRSPPPWDRPVDADRYPGGHSRDMPHPRQERDHPPFDRKDYDRDLDRRQEHFPDPRGHHFEDERGPPLDPYYDRREPPPHHHRDQGPPDRPPPVEKVIEVVPVETILNVPGRDSRPDNVSINMTANLFCH